MNFEKLAVPEYCPRIMNVVKRAKSYQCPVTSVWGSCCWERDESKRGSRDKTFQVQEKACQRLKCILLGLKGTFIQTNRGVLYLERVFE